MATSEIIPSKSGPVGPPAALRTQPHLPTSQLAVGVRRYKHRPQSQTRGDAGDREAGRVGREEKGCEFESFTSERNARRTNASGAPGLNVTAQRVSQSIQNTTLKTKKGSGFAERGPKHLKFGVRVGRDQQRAPSI